MNLIDQAKTIMQGCGYGTCEQWHCGIMSKCDVCKAKASQMLVDLTNEKEFLEEMEEWNDNTITMKNFRLNKRIMDRLKEINSAIEILEGK
jgi:hypothetical protein